MPTIQVPIKTLSENDLLSFLAGKPQKALAASEDATASDLVLAAALPKDGYVANEQMSWVANVPPILQRWRLSAATRPN